MDSCLPHHQPIGRMSTLATKSTAHGVTESDISMEVIMGFPCGSAVKNLPANARDKCSFDPWVRKIPWRRKWQPAPVFLPVIFHGQRRLEDYSPLDHKDDLANKQQGSHVATPGNPSLLHQALPVMECWLRFSLLD